MLFTDISKVKRKPANAFESGVIDQFKQKLRDGLAVKKGQKIGIGQLEDQYNHISGDSKYSSHPNSMNHESMIYSGGDEGVAIKD